MAVKDLYDKACEAANKGNYEYAIELFREVLRLEPEHPGARVLLRGTERRRLSEINSFMGTVGCYVKSIPPMVKALIQYKDARKRLEHWEDVLETSPNNMSALMAAAKSAREAGLKEVAVTVLKDILSLQADNKAALREVGDVLEESGRTKEALTALLKLSELEPNDRFIMQRLRNIEAKAHMQETHLEEAKSFRDTIRDKDSAEEAERKFETVEERRGKHVLAAEEELAQEPDNANKIIRLAALYEQEGALDKALRLLKEADARMPNTYTIRERLGDLRMRFFEDARRKAEKQLEQDPKNEALKKKRQDLAAGGIELAVREYSWRVEEHPTDVGLRFKLGNALYEAGQMDKAIACFQQATKDPKLQVDAMLMLGRCFLGKRQFDLAVQQFERVIARHPGLDEQGMNLHYLLGETLEMQGKKNEALVIYKKIYSHDISFKDISHKVESLGR